MMNIQDGSKEQSKQQGTMRTPLGEFMIGKTLGEGSYGKVKLISNVKTNEKLAVKIIKRFIPPNPETGNKGRGGKTFEQRILREANLTRFLRHSHIVPLKDCRITKSHFYLFHEYIQGSQLTDRIGRTGLKVELAAHYFEQIIDGIGYCHSNFVVHRDIKVENIMIDKEDNVKIIDFGLANFFDQKNALKTFCGSLQYSAPEIMRGDPYIGPEVDIWSIGVVLFAMLTGTLPFDDPRNPGAWECVMNGKIRWPGNMAQSPKSLITRLLDPNPKRRITMNEIVRHPFVNKRLDGPSQYRPSNFRTLPLQLDMTVIGEMTACMFQSEFAILQQLEGEMKKGKEQDGVIVVANSPLVAVYHLISNTREPIAPPKPKDPKPRSRTSNLESQPTSAAPNCDKVKDLPTRDLKHSSVEGSESDDLKNLEAMVESVPSDEIPLAIPRKEANQPMKRAATEATPAPIKLTHRTYSENGALQEPNPDKPKVVARSRPRSRTIGCGGEPVPEPAGMTRLKSDGEPSSSGSDGHWDKESYRAKRASMYETYKKLNAKNTLNSTQRREQYLAKRASLYDGLYKGPNLDDDADNAPAEDDKQPTLKRRMTLFKNKNDPTLKLLTKEERQEVLKNRIRQHFELSSPTEAKSNEREQEHGHENGHEDNQPEPNTLEMKLEKPSQEDVTKDDKVVEPGIEKASVKPAALMLSVPEVEISTELRSPFLTTSPVVVSPAHPRGNAAAHAAAPESKEPRSLPIVSNQRRYLDKILNSYRNKTNELPGHDNTKSIPSQTTRVSDRSRPVLPDAHSSEHSSRSTTLSERSKKKVHFDDHPLDASPPSANEIFETLNQPAASSELTSSESSDDISTKDHEIDFEDGKVSLFKSKSTSNKGVNDVQLENKLLAPLVPRPADIQVCHVEVSPVENATTALASSTTKTNSPLNSAKVIHPTVAGDFDVVPGVPQVSITECLRSNVIKIAKINISSLSDHFLDTLATNQIDYEWLETAFDFLILVPYSLIKQNGTGLLSVTIEMVHITRARSSAILLKDCQLGSVDSQTVDPQYPNLVKKYLQSLF